MSRWAKVAAILVMEVWLCGQDKPEQTLAETRALKDRLNEVSGRLDRELRDVNKTLDELAAEVISADRATSINPGLPNTFLAMLTQVVAEKKGLLRATDRRIKLLADELGVQLVDVDEQKNNEAFAYKTLKNIFEAENVWRKADIDRNGIHDYWTLDVAGLFYAKRLEKGDKIEAMLIDIGAAKSDPSAGNWRNSGLPTPYTPVPQFGYHFVAIWKDGDGTPYSQIFTTEDLDGTGFPHNVACTNTTRFGFVAYPAEYGISGRLTFIINQWGTIFYKDTQGAPLKQWPSHESQDPAALLNDGWEIASYK